MTGGRQEKVTAVVSRLRSPGAKLGLLAFVSGAVLMGLQISGSRILSPHFGGSIYVWGALLSVFMSGLAGGYFAGGALADSRPRANVLGFAAGGAGMAVLVVPLLGEPVCAAAFPAGPMWGPLLAAALLFGAPSFLMGIVSPFCLRLYAQSLKTAGTAAGSMFMVSTLGSLAGTFAATFILILLFSTGSIMAVLGLSLAAAGAVVMVKRSAAFAVYAISTTVFATVIFTFPAPRIELAEAKDEISHVVEEIETPYHRIFVVEGESLYGFEPARYLQFDRYKESGILLSEPFDSATKYTDLFHLVFLFNKRPGKLLFIGGGGMIGPRMFADNYPFVGKIDVVEIDGAVVDVAERHFHFRRAPPVEVHTVDGRVFLSGSDGTYDAVFLDIFSAGGRIPFHMTTTEFFAEVGKKLAPGGVCVMNIISSVEGKKSRIFQGLRKAFETAFGQVYSFPRLYHRIQHVDDFDREVSRNIFLVGTVSGTRIGRAEIESLGEKLTREGAIPAKFELDMHSRNLLDPGDPPPDAGTAAPTDGFNPIELWKFW